MNKINIILFYRHFQLCDLYENDSIFDKFECCLSGDGLRVATGSYGYFFHPLLIACFHFTEILSINTSISWCLQLQ